MDGNTLIESSGLYGQSYIWRYDSLTGVTQARTELQSRYFAEGLALADGKLYCLTWRRGRALVFDKDSLQQLDAIRYRGEGWGLASYDAYLIMSDGSEFLTLRDPATFAIRKKISVLRNGQPQRHINDLTHDGERIWANIWREDYLVAIDPQSGAVVGELNLAGLRSRQGNSEGENVLNGIAWDAQYHAMWVTGKRWPMRYLIQLLGPGANSNGGKGVEDK